MSHLIEKTLEDEAVPSLRKDLLASMLGAIVVDVVRYSSFPPLEACKELGISPVSVFSLTAGPLLITLSSGRVIGFASQPSLASVTLWLEKESGAAVDERNVVLADEELHPIHANDAVFSLEGIRQLPDRRIVAVHVLKLEHESPVYVGLPCEAGVVLSFDSGAELIPSHGLHDDSDDFSVITRGQIKPSLLARLSEVDLAEL